MEINKTFIFPKNLQFRGADKPSNYTKDEKLKDVENVYVNMLTAQTWKNHVNLVRKEHLDTDLAF